MMAYMGRLQKFCHYEWPRLNELENCRSANQMTEAGQRCLCLT